MILKEITQYLESKGLGTQATNIFADLLPDEPDNIICVFSSPAGPMPLRIPDINVAFQFRVRNTKYEDAYTKIHQIFNIFDDGTNHSISLLSGRRILLRPSSPPMFLTYDMAGRANFIYSISGITKRD